MSEDSDSDDVAEVTLCSTVVNSSYALVVLSIPASEVACERAFSTAGAFYTDARARMSDRTLRNLMFVHANDPQLYLWREERRNTDDEEDEWVTSD